MLKGGLSPEDCVQVATRYAGSGLIDFISVVGGNAVDYQGEAKLWPTMWVPSAAYLPLAKAIRDEVADKVRIFHATRMTDAATAMHALKSGSVDMVGMTRAFLADPHHVNKLKAGKEEEIRPCVGAGYCVDRVIRGLDAFCVHNVATTREASIPQTVTPTAGPIKKVVIVGGGPAGMEAARISARRGHRVVLFEAARELGGQLLLAAKATWKLDMAGITAWLVGQMELLSVDVRCNAYAEAADVLSERPDVVVVATGGSPNVGKFEGAALAVTTWDVLASHVACGRDILLIDENGSAPGISCAEFAAARGSNVRFATPDREIGRELGGTNLGAHMTELYKLGVTVEVDVRLVSVVKSGNKLLATLANTYTGRETELTVDQVIGENGTLPNDEVYFDLKEKSKNRGEVDLRRLIELEPQVAENNPSGAFQLFRIGDAWTSRNLHAAMLDAARIAHPL
jgi:NADPH-dependent 2,4-dienoyl-CoA reductase/sulfur reductase-like enzyme